jgi:hypothetical protein
MLVAFSSKDAIVGDTIVETCRSDDLHLGDVLIALRKADYIIDRKSGLLRKDGAESKAA